MLHIGYPKTGSTTLQESLFKGLHSKGIVKYCGRNGFKENRFNGKDIAIEFRRNSLYYAPLPSTESLDENLLNVISDENFLMLSSINSIQYKSDNDYKLILKKILDHLSQCQVEVLVV